MQKSLHEVLHILVQRLVQKLPAQGDLLVPLVPLGEFLAHEQKLLARMSEHVGVAALQVRELVLEDARHLVDHGTLQVDHLIVRQDQDIVFTGEVGQTEGHLVVVVLAEIGIELHVLKEIVHPSHVPLEGEAEAVVLRSVSDHGPCGALLRDDHGAVVPAGDDGIQVLEELDRFQILVAAVLVRAPVASGSAVVQVQHGCDSIDAESVHVILVQPVQRIADQEVLDLCLLIVEDLSAPVRMLALPGVSVLIAGLSVEVRKAEGIPREVCRDPVEDDADAVLVHVIHKILEILRQAVAGGGGVITRDLIAPAAVEGVLRDAHQLDVGVAHVLHVGSQFMRVLAVIAEAVTRGVLVPLPGTQVALVDTHGHLPRIHFGTGLHPLLVVELVVPGLARKL